MLSLKTLKMPKRTLYEEKVLALIASIREKGVLEPVVIDKLHNIKDGFHRCEACRRINPNMEIPVVIL